MLVYVIRYRILLIFLHLVNLCSSNNCSVRIFGPFCDLECNCAGGCSDEGFCSGVAGRCFHFLFGPGCQFVDVVAIDAHNPLSRIPKFVSDMKNTTCNPNASDVAIHLDFINVLRFSWARIVVNDPSEILNFQTTFNDGVKCWNERKFIVNNMTVDIRCDINLQMKSIHIVGPAVSTLCDLHISGGRNVAFRQNTWQSTNYEKDVLKCGSQNAVDGILPGFVSYESGHCSRTSVEASGPEWGVSFRIPAILHKIQIDSLPLMDVDMFYAFHLSFFDIDGNMDTLITAYNATAKYTQPLTISTPISTLIITQLTIGHLATKELTLCEVVVQGDPVCPDNKFDLFCEKQCNCNETEECNVITGECAPGCPRGQYGFNCSLNCSSHCAMGYCYYSSGRCSPCSYGYFGVRCDKECLPGTYGLSALCTDCSEGCSNICNKTTGTCTCKPGHEGARCDACSDGKYAAQLPCSDCSFGCSDICNKITGNCECKFGYGGKRCDVCYNGKYGDTLPCTNCSEGCSSICNSITGYCMCKTGYGGVRCEDCLPGIYGDNCEFPCSWGCDTVCNRSDGSCYCKPHFRGTHCTDCIYTYYGRRCDLVCSGRCANRTCLQTNGKCIACVPGHIGDTCVRATFVIFPWVVLAIFLLLLLLLICIICSACINKNDEIQQQEGTTAHSVPRD